MGNPILEGMKRQTNNQNSIMSVLQMAKGNPDAFLAQMMKTNPQFAKFVEGCKGKNPEQIMKQYGLDPAMLKNIMK